MNLPTVISGQHLIDLGFTPNRHFKSIIEYANSHSLSEEELKQYVMSTMVEEKEPHSKPVFYHKNIHNESGSLQEQQNINKVFQAMDEVMKAPTVITGAIMPDACPTGEGQIPVGGIVVTKNAIHPALHSSDICCSLKATHLPSSISCKLLLDVAFETTHFGPGGRKDQFKLPEELEEKIVKNLYLKNELHIAKSHLGTQGDGNHFLFVGTSEANGSVVLITHHGSRGLGAGLYKTGMKITEKFRKEISPKSSNKNPWIPYNTKEGEIYWEALQVVRDWTKYNHEIIHKTICEKLKIESTYFSYWNEHNFVFKENDLFYHAKGATPLDNKFVPDSTYGFRIIPMNMSEPILIVSGKTTKNNLGFAPHGAGRNISRRQHELTNKNNRSEIEIFKEETKGLDVRFFSNFIDISELPSAYKNADVVKKQMNDYNLGNVLDEIKPYGCIMAGDWQRNAFWKKTK